MDERFSYRGPAVVDGLPIADLELVEITDIPNGLRDLRGSATLSPDVAAALLDKLGDRLSIELPDMRRGMVMVASITDDLVSWSADVLGFGPPPSYSYLWEDTRI